MNIIQRFFNTQIFRSGLFNAQPYLIVVLAVSLSVGAYSAFAHGESEQSRQRGRRETAKPKTPDTQKESPDQAFERARSAESQDERITLMEKFLTAHKGSAFESQAHELLMREYALRGEQKLREGNPQHALRDFKAVFKHAPAEMNDRVFGQFIFPLPLAMSAFGYRVESVELMRSFEERFKNDPNRLIQIGFFYVQIEAPIEAVRVLEKTVRMAPDNHRAHNGLGTAYLINLRLDDAAAEFEKALELNPRDEFANLNIANLARAAGDDQKAVTYYRQQLAFKPDDSEARGGLALALLALGRNEEADPEIKRALEIAPEDYRFLTQLAFFYINRRKPLLARPYMERAARIEPRYVWVFIAKANIDALEARYGDALAALIQAQTHGGFPTLKFELAKALMSLDGYDQALDVIKEAFTVTEEGEFEATLGGVMKARSPRLDLLLERERKAALFLNDYPTTSLQYRLAEALGRIDSFSKMMAEAREKQEAAKGRGRRGKENLQEATRPRRVSGSSVSASAELSAGGDSELPGADELIRALTIFTTQDDGRQAFRMVWASRKLTENGVALDAAEQLARRAIDMAEVATGPEGSMRDAPLLDREGRRLVFLGRAYDALGWALFKKGNTRGAIENLAKSVDIYPMSIERKNALWHLGVATEQAGDEKRALEFYIASYQPDSPDSSARRAQIERLYKKVHGSLDGLSEKLQNR